MKASYAVQNCDFYIYGTLRSHVGATEPKWVLVGSTSKATYVYNSSILITAEISASSPLQYFTVYVNSTGFIDGPVQLKVVAKTSTVGTMTLVQGATIANGGRSLCYTTSDEGGLYPMHRGVVYSLALGDCTTDIATNQLLIAAYTITSVSYYEEMVVDNQMTSNLLATSTTEPFGFQTPLISQSTGTQVTYKAVVTSFSKDRRRRSLLGSFAYQTSAIFTAVVLSELASAVPTSAPTIITHSPISSFSSPPSPVICITNTTGQHYVASIRPNITHIYQSHGGDASGGEIIRLYGFNYGTNHSLHGVVVNDPFVWSVCQSARWKEATSYNPLYGAIGKAAPYVECITAPTSVGRKNVTIFVDSLMSMPFTRYEVTCKAGYYGSVGELCVSCKGNQSSSYTSPSGMSCLADNMTNPISSPGKINICCVHWSNDCTLLTLLLFATHFYLFLGFYILYDPYPSPNCPSTTLGGVTVAARDVCPYVRECSPPSACIGDNLCASGYSGSLCSSCDIGRCMLGILLIALSALLDIQAS